MTTHQAGMAVPDWPSTYGYNLFAYPWQTWIFGPWDLFIEHGHRLLGAAAGLITIALVIAVHRYDQRRWLRLLCLAALALVVFQGVLGGARVLLDERQLALVHGCVGPAFFALAAALCVFTSRIWRAGPQAPTNEANQKMHRLTFLTLLLVYAQLVIGAHLRHLPAMASGEVFRAALFFHLFMAAAVVVHVVLLNVRMWRSRPRIGALYRPALLLAALAAVQVLLGSGAYVVKYSWPAWLADFQFAAAYIVQARSPLQSTVVTAHVATGSLILAVSTVLALRSFRLAPARAAAIASSALLARAVS